MPSTLPVAPPPVAFSDSPVWVEVLSGQAIQVASYFELVVSGGPTTGQTLTITWPAGEVVYTAGSTDADGTAWPLRGGGEPLSDYANRLADFLQQREDVTDTFTVSREADSGSNPVLRLTAQIAQAYTLSVTGVLTGVAVTAWSVGTDGPDNLRALVRVQASTGNPATDVVLADFHSPYQADTGRTQIEISSAFAHLQPWLPDENTINPASLPVALPFAECVGMYQRYYLRHADKYGTPAVAEALLRTSSVYTALLGSRALDSTSTDWPLLRHNYRRRDGQVFEKPVSMDQPDWIYWYDRDGEAVDVYVSLLLYWSDGTTSVYEPWGVDPEPVDPERLYVFPSGFIQMGLNAVTPPGGTNPDAYIELYDWRLGPPDETDTYYLASVRYRILFDSDWGQYLLFLNGFGGLETVWLRGKSEQQLQVATAEADVPALPDGGRGLQQRRIVQYGTTGRREWKCSTGWYDDTYYLEHLQQVPLSDGAWLVDTARRRFLPVTVEARDLRTRIDDETLISLDFTIRAAWRDSAHNH